MLLPAIIGGVMLSQYSDSVRSRAFWFILFARVGIFNRIMLGEFLLDDLLRPILAPCFRVQEMPSQPLTRIIFGVGDSFVEGHKSYEQIK